MKKRLPIACIYAILFLATNNMTFEVKAQKRSQTSDPDWKNWSDERITQWEDSVINAQYPSPKIEQYTTAYAIPKSEVPEISQPIPTPLLKSSTTSTLSTNIDKSKAFGEIPVISGHGLNGAATLQIPIQIYPGSNGIQPQISLFYSSGGGNGTLGAGWSLTGISKITRINRSGYYDGQPNGVSLTNDDAFSLDGMRLIKLSSNASSIRYESEQGKIIAIAYLSNNVISHFQVLYPNGKKGIYGYTTSTGNSLEYPLINMTDPSGNTINYTYIGTHQKHISSITYGDNSSASIDFVYETTRPDPIRLYIGGLQITENRRLVRINCKYGSHLLHSYEIAYAMNIYSLIKEINFTAQGKYFNPLRFNYGTGNTNSTFNKSTVQLLEWYNFGDSPNTISVRKGKFDYGSDDEGVITYPTKESYYNHYRNKTLFRHSQNRYDNRYDGTEKIFLYAGLSGNMAAPMPNLLTEPGFVDIFCADIDGKNEEEVIKVNNTIFNGYDRVVFKVYSGNVYSGIGLRYTRTFDFTTVLTDADGGKSIHPKFYFTGDFNGNGKMEVLAVSAHNPIGKSDITSKCYLFDLENGTKLYEKYDFPHVVDFFGTRQTDAQTAFYNTDRILILDYNGDGKSDICHINDSGTSIYTFEGSGVTYSLKKIATYSNLKKSTIAGRDLMVGEFNGDGLLDLLISPNADNTNTWNIYHSNGNGSFTMSSFTGPQKTTRENEGFMLQDINSDGLTDLIFYNSRGFTTYLTKNGIPSAITPSPSNSTFGGENNYAKLLPTNINSRNVFCQLLAIKNGKIIKYSFPRDDTREHMLSSVVNSFGVESRFDYEKLNGNGSNNSGPLYNKGSGAAFPYVNFNGPLWVLSISEIWHNGSKLESVSYNYHNAVIHKQGLGFRGFERIRVNDNIRNRHYTKEINPYLYMIPNYDESPTSKTTYQFSVSVQTNKILNLRLTSVTNLDKIKNLSSTSTYTHDSYGNVITENTTLPDGIKITITNKYVNYTTDAAYLLGFLYDQTKVTTRNGGSSTIRFYYPSYSNKGLPNSKISMVDGMVVKQEAYLYDILGKITMLTETTYNSEPLTTTFQYDAFGRMIKSTNPMGFSSEAHYASNGMADYSLNYKGQKTSYSYDEFGRLLSSINPAGQTSTTLFAWSETGNNSLYCVTKTDAGQSTQKIWYDALGREKRSAQQRFDGLWTQIDYLYDTYGRLHKASQPFTGSAGSLWTTYTYNVYDQILSVTQPSGKSTTYSYNGLTTTIISDGITTVRTYDALGGMVSSKDTGGTVTFLLRADGQPSTIEAPGGIRTTFTYDSFGRQISMVDPSAGIITYGYDNSGNLNRQVDAEGRVTTMVFDKFGRVTSKTTPELSTNYDYNAYGLIAAITSNNGISTTFSYDTFNRVKTNKEIGADGIWLQKDYNYSADGNIESLSYLTPTGTIATEIYVYTNGTLSEIRLNGTTSIFKLSAQNAIGQPTAITTGPLTRGYSYNNFGMPTGRTTSNSQGQLENSTYLFDAATGNLISRKDGSRNLTENFGYDNLNRLITFGNHMAEYDGIGNLTSKSDIGTFNYNNISKPYAISAANITNGSVPLRLQKVNYNSFKQPSSITENDYIADFTYNCDGQRVKMSLKENGSLKLTRYYLGGSYEKDQGVAGTKEKLYLGGDAYSAPAVYVKQGSGNWQLFFICRDYLGSITHLVNSNGSLTQELSYDAWGRLRNPNNHVTFTPGNEPELFLGRGFTGHEHLPWFGLINMNGRLYDPAISRFLSPDNYVQAPDYSQSFNRYAYCWNNPLKYTDPDGEWVHIVVGAVVGGVINLGIKAYQGKINNFGDGLMAFGIGAAAGAIGAATGGTAFLAAGGGAAGAGGFLAGAAGGMVGSAFASPIQSIGNSVYFGDPLMTGKQYLMGIAIGGLVGGTINGGIAIGNGKTFMTGDIKGTRVHTSGPTPTLKLDRPEVKDVKLITDDWRPQLKQMPDDNRFSVTTRQQDISYTTSDGVKITISRPDINGYHPSLTSKTDLYHNFPLALDKPIIQGGDWAQRIVDGAAWFQAPGTINGTQGMYQIGVNSNGIIFHRVFVPF